MEATILASTDSNEKDTLSSLRDDIEQLIILTKQNLSELEGTSSADSVSGVPARPNTANDDPFAQEYALFKAELEAEEKSPENDAQSKALPAPDIAVSIFGSFMPVLAVHHTCDSVYNVAKIKLAYHRQS